MMMTIHTDDDDERERYVDSQIVRSPVVLKFRGPKEGDTLLRTQKRTIENESLSDKNRAKRADKTFARSIPVVLCGFNLRERVGVTLLLDCIFTTRRQKPPLQKGQNRSCS